MRELGVGHPAAPPGFVPASHHQGDGEVVLQPRREQGRARQALGLLQPLQRPTQELIAADRRGPRVAPQHLGLE